MIRRRVLVAVLLALATAAPSVASCQTYYCQVNQARRSLERLADAERALADGEAPSDWILYEAKYRGAHIRRVAIWDRQFRWEPQPALEVPPEVRTADDAAYLRLWQRRVASGAPAAQAVRARCELAKAEEDLATALAVLWDGVEPADEAAAQLAVCHAEVIAAAEGAGAAESYLVGYLDEHPDAAVVRRRLVGLLDAQGRRDESLVWLEFWAGSRPEDLGAQRALLGRYVLEGLPQRRDALLSAIESRGPAPSEHATLCDVFRHQGRRAEISDAARDELEAGRLACYERLLAAAPVADPTDDDARALRKARDAFLWSAIHHGDAGAVETALARFPASELPETWRDVLRWRDDLCPLLRAAFSQGTLAAVETNDPRVWHARDEIAAGLEDCDAAAEAARLRALPRERPPAPPDVGYPFATYEDLERRALAEPGVVDHHRGLMYASRTRPVADRIRNLERWANAIPEDPYPAVRLAELEEDEGRSDAAIDWWLEAIRRGADEVDVAVRLGRAGLRVHRHDVVELAAEHIQTSRQASARQRAEAEYLLGRVARREGRWEEASRRLTGYFLRRIRYVGCYGVTRCDEGLIAHLFEAGDREGLAAYLAGRDDANAERKRLIEPGEGNDRTAPIVRVDSPEEWSPDVLRAYLERWARRDPTRGTPWPPDGLEEVRARPTDADCAPDLGAAEALFPDDALLGLHLTLTEVG